MRVSQVHINVRPGCEEAFKSFSIENAKQSILEPGIVRFDILQSDADPTSFILFEVYHSAQAQDAHKETDHFLKWQTDVKDLITAPGRATIYSTIFPDDGDWSR